MNGEWLCFGFCVRSSFVYMHRRNYRPVRAQFNSFSYVSTERFHRCAFCVYLFRISVVLQFVSFVVAAMFFCTPFGFLFLKMICWCKQFFASIYLSLLPCSHFLSLSLHKFSHIMQKREGEEKRERDREKRKKNATEKEIQKKLTMSRAQYIFILDDISFYFTFFSGFCIFSNPNQTARSKKMNEKKKIIHPTNEYYMHESIYTNTKLRPTC